MPPDNSKIEPTGFLYPFEKKEDITSQVISLIEDYHRTKGLDSISGNFLSQIIRFLKQKISSGGVITNYFSLYPLADTDTNMSLGTEYDTAGALKSSTVFRTLTIRTHRDININSIDGAGDGIINLYAGGTATNSGGFIGLDNANIDFDIAAATSGRLGVRKRNGELVFRFPNLSATPSTCTIGEICVANAKLQICTATNVWTIVGTQT